MMNIQVRYFAGLREALGSSQVVMLHAGATLADLRDHLMAQDSLRNTRLAREQAVRMAVNQVLVMDETVVLSEASEVAFFPPVTGG